MSKSNLSPENFTPARKGELFALRPPTPEERSRYNARTAELQERRKQRFSKARDAR